MLSALFAAEAGERNVRMYQVTAEVQNIGGYTHCIVNNISLGDFSTW
jgi:hypothetical protein